MKKTKHKEAHSANMKYGMGDNYGTGIKAKVGRIIQGTGVNPASPKKIKTPPRSLA